MSTFKLSQSSTLPTPTPALPREAGAPDTITSPARVSSLLTGCAAQIALTTLEQKGLIERNRGPELIVW
jgi:hypothetical protein